MAVVSKAGKHRNQSRHYLDNAMNYLAKGDAEKASEFLWGSMTQALKALAASRGITLRSHNELREFAKGLARELNDESIWNAYREAQSLHSNFYETGLLLEDIVEGAEKVKSAMLRIFSFIPEENLHG